MYKQLLRKRAEKCYTARSSFMKEQSDGVKVDFLFLKMVNEAIDRSMNVSVQLSTRHIPSSQKASGKNPCHIANQNNLCIQKHNVFFIQKSISRRSSNVSFKSNTQGSFPPALLSGIILQDIN